MIFLDICWHPMTYDLPTKITRILLSKLVSIRPSIRNTHCHCYYIQLDSNKELEGFVVGKLRLDSYFCVRYNITKCSESHVQRHENLYTVPCSIQLQWISVDYVHKCFGQSHSVQEKVEYVKLETWSNENNWTMKMKS